MDPGSNAGGNGRRSPAREPDEGLSGDEHLFSEEEPGEEPERSRGPLSLFPSPFHSLPAIVLFMACYGLTAVYNSYPEGDLLWASGNSVYMGHEYWRLLTAIFTHSSMVHLFSNALMFLVFGWMLKAYFGMLAFPLVSTLIGLVTSAITVALYDPAVRLVGASGMAYGMVALWLVFYVRNDLYHSLPLRMFRATGFALIMMFPSTFEPQVSYLAHAVGFAAGLAAGLLLMNVISVRDPS